MGMITSLKSTLFSLCFCNGLNLTRSGWTILTLPRASPQLAKSHWFKFSVLKKQASGIGSKLSLSTMLSHVTCCIIVRPVSCCLPQVNFKLLVETSEDLE